MHAALKQAQLAMKSSEPPFGCVLVDSRGEILLEEHDRVCEMKDMSAHGETLLLKKACRALAIDDLQGYTLYTTVEPCAMCFTAGWLNRLSNIVYGASMQDISNITQGAQREIAITCKEMNKRSGNTMVVTGNILKDEAIKQFSGYDYL